MIHDRDLDIAPGERVLLAGPSGAGKSTLLRAAAGVLASAGDGESFGTVAVDGPAGLLLQNPGDSVVADLVGRDVAFGPENLGLPRDEIWRRVDHGLGLVGFPYPRSTPTGTLSGGETQRLALAGALALRPGLLLLDEPTSMLDDESAALVRRAVLDVVDATGATLVVVEHRLEPWLDHVDRLVVLGPGGVIACDASPGAALESEGERLAAAGLWVPVVAAPVPSTVPPALVRPDAGPGLADLTVRTRDLGVTLRTRGLRSSRSQRALDGVSVGLDAGKVTAFTGRSGAGKSTLVAALAGLLRPTDGAVEVVPSMASGSCAAPWRWRSSTLAARVGWVPQDPEHGLVARSVRDEVRVTAGRLGRVVDVDALLALMGLEHLAGADPRRLSGGEQRRLALIAALAHRPALALLDEPTVGQDRNTWAAVAGWLATSARCGVAVGVSTHDRLLVETVVDARVHLVAGSVVDAA